MVQLVVPCMSIGTTCSYCLQCGLGAITILTVALLVDGAPCRYLELRFSSRVRTLAAVFFVIKTLMYCQAYTLVAGGTLATPPAGANLA